MSLSVTIRDLQTLILSFHPVIVIETVEEEPGLHPVEGCHTGYGHTSV